MMSTITARHIRRHSNYSDLPGHKRGEKREKGTWRTKSWTPARYEDFLDAMAKSRQLKEEE